MAAGANYSDYSLFSAAFPEHAKIVPAIEKRMKQFEEYTAREHDQVQSIRLESLPVLRKINERGFVTYDSQDGWVGENDLQKKGEIVLGSNGKPMLRTINVERSYVEGMVPKKLYEKVKANWPKWSPFELYNFKSDPEKRIPLVIYTVTLSDGKKEKHITSNLWVPMEYEEYMNAFKNLAESEEKIYGGGVSDLSAITPDEWIYIIMVDTRWGKDAFAEDGLFTFGAKILEKSLKDLSKVSGGTRKRRRAVKRKNISRRR